MKTTTPMQRVDEPAGATAGCPRRGAVRWALTGFGVGVVSATAYLLLGVQHFRGSSLWAEIVFYPSVLAGLKVSVWGSEQSFFTTWPFLVVTL
jgi:hypothetical protein